jgi:hypothetical protein
MDLGYLKHNEYPVLRHEGGYYYLDSPVLHEQPWSDHLTSADLRLGVADMTMSAGLHRHWIADGKLHVEGWAYRAGRSMGVEDGQITAWLQDVNERKTAMAVERWSDARVDERSGHHYCDYRGGAFRASIELSSLSDQDNGMLEFHVGLDIDGIAQQNSLLRHSRADSSRDSSRRAAGGEDGQVERP